MRKLVVLKIFRDPVSGLTHFAGALFGVWALIYLVQKAGNAGNTRGMMAFAVFGTSVILLYAASSLYHLLHVSEAKRLILRRLDHSMIAVLIAGSYTPYCVLALRGTGGWAILITVWILALGAMIKSIFWINAPRWVTAGIYLIMGWLAVFAIKPFYQTLTAAGLLWLVAGGMFYSVGAVIYAIKRPNPFPPHFGFHEIWHLFVLAGTLCHFLSVATLV